ncbi:MAG TPA: formate/nitrite transporter family protein [Gemmatimonadaceae bacterium]|nr:formate/nitrite transporter family protein [Gemmatimonadaceae bacterium]
MSARKSDAPTHLDEEGHETWADAETQYKAREEESLDAATTHEVVRREAQKELDRSPAALAWSGLAAGLAMGFTLVTEGVLRAHLPDAEWRPLVTKLGYAVGFLIVILGSQQLYTENTLEPVVPLLNKPTRERFTKMLRLWGIVFLANVVGTLLFSLYAARTSAFDEKLKAAFLAIGLEALEPSPGTIFLKAIAAGMIIALMVWMLPAAKTAHIWVIGVMAWLVGAASLSHVIVGSVETSYLMWRGAASVGEYLGHFMLPTLLGNTIGGVALVALINHKQVTAGES